MHKHNNDDHFKFSKNSSYYVWMYVSTLFYKKTINLNLHITVQNNQSFYYKCVLCSVSYIFR